VLEEGKEVEYNVNRLIKQYIWDDINMDTSGVLRRREERKREEREREEAEEREENEIVMSAPEIRETIIFPMVANDHHQSPFGVGKILSVDDENLSFQWLGNLKYTPGGVFLPGWIDTADKGYYALERSDVRNHRPWTGKDSDLRIRVADLLLKGRTLLDPEWRLTKRTHKRLVVALRAWGKTYKPPKTA